MPKSPDGGPGRSSRKAMPSPPGQYTQGEYATPASPQWQPERHPVHRLIQLLDVIVIADNRGRQLLGMTPHAGMAICLGYQQSEGFDSIRNQILVDRGELITSIFTDDAAFIEAESLHMENDAIAYLRRSGHPDPDQPVREAVFLLHGVAVGQSLMGNDDEWPTRVGLGAATIRALPGKLLPDLYTGARAGLLSCLARVGETVPAEIHNRDRYGLYALTQEWGDDRALDRLFGWVIQTHGELAKLKAFIDTAYTVYNEVCAVTHSQLIARGEPHWEVRWGKDYRHPWWERKLRLLSASVRELNTASKPTASEWRRMTDDLVDALRRGLRMIELPPPPGDGAPDPPPREAPTEEEVSAWGDSTVSLLGSVREVSIRQPRMGQPALPDVEEVTLSVVMDVVGGWRWPDPTVCDNRYHELDVLLDLADRICTCVATVAGTTAGPAAVTFPTGGRFLRELHTRRHTVLGIDTSPHANLQEWRAMVTALADTLAEGLHLTEARECERWRLRYVEQVSVVRGVRTRLSPAGPYTPVANPGVIQYLEQRGPFGPPASPPPGRGDPDAVADLRRKTEPGQTRSHAEGSDGVVPARGCPSPQREDDLQEELRSGSPDTLDFSERKHTRHRQVLIKMLALGALDGEYVIQANIVKAIEPSSVENGRVKGKWPAVFALLSRKRYTEGQTGGSDPGVTLTERGKAAAEHLKGKTNSSDS